MKIVSILNQENNIVKTTTINLAAGIASKGKKVLIMDFNPQAQATIGLGIEKTSLTYNSYDLLNIKELEISKIIKKTNQEGLFILPATIELASFARETHLHESNELRKILETKLEKINNQFDFVFIDCPSRPGMLVNLALEVSDSVLIPLLTEENAFDGLTQLLSTISIIKRSLNDKLFIEGILIIINSENKTINEAIEKEVKRFFKEKVYKTIIPKTQELNESFLKGVTIFDYSKNSKVAKKYNELANEFLL